MLCYYDQMMACQKDYRPVTAQQKPHARVQRRISAKILYNTSTFAAQVNVATNPEHNEIIDIYTRSNYVFHYLLPEKTKLIHKFFTKIAPIIKKLISFGLLGQCR